MFPPEKLKLKQILSDAILLLCRSALPFDSELSIQALIGVTCDQSDICLLSIEEVIKKSAADDGHAEDELEPSAVHSSQTSSSLCKKSNEKSNDDPILTSSSSPLAEGSSQNTKHHSRKKKWPGDDGKIGETSPVAVCSDSAKSARPCSYDNYEVESAAARKRRRLEQSANHSSFQRELDANRSKRRIGVPSCLNSSEVQQSEQQNQQLSDSTQAYNSACERSADSRRAENSTFSSDVIEIKTEPDEDETSVQEEFSEVSFTDQFQDDGVPFSFGGICRAPYQFQTTDRNFNFQQRHQRSAVSSLPQNGNVGDADLQLDESMSTLICQHVLKYEGPFVTVRDMQRRRLRQVPANHIKSSMNQLTVDGLGFYKTLCLGIMVFYKCPPSIVDPDVLQRYNVSHEHYAQFYNQKPYMTSSNKHTDSYWDRIIMSSPYTEEI